MGELQGAVLVRNKCHVFNFGWDGGQFKLKKEQRNILTQFSPIAGTDFIQSGSFGLLVLSWIFLRKKIFLHILSFTPSNTAAWNFHFSSFSWLETLGMGTSSLPFKAPFWHHRVRELSAFSSLIPFSLQVQRSSCNSGFFIRTIAITFDYILKFTFLYLLYLCCIICCKSNILCENDRLNFETNPKAKTYFESNAKRWRQPTLGPVKNRCLTFPK